MNNVTIKHNLDIIDQQSYQSGYAGGYSEGLDNGYEIGYVACWLDQWRAAEALREQKSYIRKQKIAGWSLIGVSILSAVLLLDGTFCFIGIPLGLGLIFTKERWFA